MSINAPGSLNVFFIFNGFYMKVCCVGSQKIIAYLRRCLNLKFGSLGFFTLIKQKIVQLA